MPRFDQTGPEGNGPQAGGRRGQCGAENTTQNRPRGFGRGMRRNNVNQEDVSGGWRQNRRGGDVNGPGFGGGQRKRFRRGQD